jgi:hypothetical protein
MPAEWSIATNVFEISAADKEQLGQPSVCKWEVGSNGQRRTAAAGDPPFSLVGICYEL